AALVPLTILFLVMVAPLVGESRETVLAAFTNPLRAVITILFIVVSFKHLADGLHEVIVDYVHGQPMLTALLVGTKLGSYFVGAVGAFAVVVIAFIGITTG
ncbi:MAG: succinate dehydrogenase, hydrophobic membrane anchor protein, partial [Pseudomonadota bacterium]